MITDFTINGVTVINERFEFAITKNLTPDSVGMFFLDLPYGTTACEWDKKVNTSLLWSSIKYCMKKDAPIIFTSNQPFTTDIINSNPKMYKFPMYWMKNKVTGNMIAKNQPMRRVEEVHVFGNSSITYNPQGLVKLQKARERKGTRKGGSYVGNKEEKGVQEFENYPDNVIYFDMDADSWHPTQKPVALVEHLIKTFSNEGDLIVDLTAGSLTTGVATIRAGKRRAVLFEQKSEFFLKGKTRLENEIQQQKLSI